MALVVASDVCTHAAHTMPRFIPSLCRQAW